MKSLVVTGASKGIGYEVAKLAVENGVHVFGSVRKQDDGDRLTKEFGDNFTPLIFDTRDEAAVADAARLVQEKLGGETLFGLVNNAGTGLVGPFLHQPMEEIQKVFEINVIGTIQVSRAFAPLLGTLPELTGDKGRMVNISSLAGKFGQPFAIAYVGSKHAIEGISDVMRIELNLYGIKVIVVGPASVATPIWDHAEDAIGKYKDTDYGQAFDKAIRGIVDSSRKSGLAPRKVAETVWTALTAKRPKLRYSPAAHSLLEQALPRVMPERLTDMFFERSLGLKEGSAKSQAKDKSKK